MPLTLDENNAKYQIKSYQPGSVKINNQIYTKSLIITPTQLFENWPPQSSKDLTAANFQEILQLQPNILLIGTGEVHEFIPLEIYGHLLNESIGVEIMSTGAACRTFNALVAENRNVAAALIIA